MKFPRFDMERMQSQWEHKVKYDLSESGVEALTLAEGAAGIAAPELPESFLARAIVGARAKRAEAAMPALSSPGRRGVVRVMPDPPFRSV